MNFGAVYHFLFETMPGIGCLVGAFLVATTIVSAVLERRTRATFKDRGADPDDEDWQFDNDKEGK